MKNDTKTETVPSSGWMFHDKREWKSDPSIKITAGKLKPVSDTITIIGKGSVADKQPGSLGTFTITEKIFNGKPVWKNERGRYLHSANDSTWSVGYEIGSCRIRSSSAPMNPADAHSWVYYSTMWGDMPANITVTCSTNNKN